MLTVSFLMSDDINEKMQIEQAKHLQWHIKKQTADRDRRNVATSEYLS
jgi:hypothetical protein